MNLRRYAVLLLQALLWSLLHGAVARGQAPALLTGEKTPRLRVATFNASLNRTTAGALSAQLLSRTNTQAKVIAEIIQRVRPDVILINEFDYDTEGLSLARFHDNYLAVSQNGQPPLSYPHRFSFASNTGVASGLDLDNDGVARSLPPPSTASNATKDAYGNDCWGFGWFPGQYGMAVYSKYPLGPSGVRTFQKFLWKDLPEPQWPDLSSTSEPQDYYSATERSQLRLSSKSHWDVPLAVSPGLVFHLLCSHPTPPAFDGSEDRNGRRNFDEIRFWRHYIEGAPFIYDDADLLRPTFTPSGGLAAQERFVLLGDLNADPHDGASYRHAVRQLLDHPLINNSRTPMSEGAVAANTAQGGVNTSHVGNPAADTADFADAPVATAPGNLRVDHVIPSQAGLSPVAAGVFWPLPTLPEAALATNAASSDHRLVWLDIAVVPRLSWKTIEGPQAGQLTLRWTTEPGAIYQVQTSTDLQGWTAVDSIIEYLPELQEATASVNPGNTRFFRVVGAFDF